MTIAAYLKQFTTGTTAADVMKAHNGIAPGFDFLRLFLSLSILTWHCFKICYGNTGHINSYLFPVIHILVPTFFCLSGFLVTGSAMRLKSLKLFGTFRILRIIPALMVEVSLSAIVLGGVITTLPRLIYYTSKGFYGYFGNIIGKVHLYLPGVFVNHPSIYVNGNLWTLPAEYYCYIFMAMMMLSKPLYYSRTCFIVLVMIAFMASFYLRPEVYAKPFTPVSQNGTWLLVCYFVLGSAAYRFIEYIPLRKTYFIASIFLYYLFSCFQWHNFLVALALTYCTVYLGMLRFPHIPILQNGDYSYGIYLYGFPITQSIWHFIPLTHNASGILFLFVAPTTILFSVFSWHYIEKPALKLKRLLAKDKVLIH